MFESFASGMEDSTGRKVSEVEKLTEPNNKCEEFQWKNLSVEKYHE